MFAIYSTSPKLCHKPATYSTDVGEHLPFVYEVQEEAQAMCDKLNAINKELRVNNPRAMGHDYPYEVRCINSYR